MNKIIAFAKKRGGIAVCTIIIKGKARTIGRNGVARNIGNYLNLFDCTLPIIQFLFPLAADRSCVHSNQTGVAFYPVLSFYSIPVFLSYRQSDVESLVATKVLIAIDTV